MLTTKRDSLLIGAAIGVGIAAQAAERGGADFLLALAVGRYRVMGAASSAAMLPIGSSNAFTDRFARDEILDRVGIPVFIGISATDPREDFDTLASQLKSAGYSGVANFPSCIHLDGTFRDALEAQGLGLAREAAMLSAARRVGLSTLAYAKTRSEIDLLLAATTIDMLCINFGWNSGGSRGVPGPVSIAEAARRARRLTQRIRKTSPETLCVVEGGPIVSPSDMARVCREAQADGYVGGSTLDRLPLELSVIQSTSAFKTAGLGGGAADADGREFVRVARLAGLAGQSDAFRNLIDAIARFASNDIPLLICGEAGAGKTSLARAMHVLSGRTGTTAIVEPADPLNDDLLQQPTRTIVIEAIDKRDRASLHRLTTHLARSRWSQGPKPPPGAARIIATMSDRGKLPEQLAGLLADGTIVVPPLRDRPMDIAPQVRAMLRALTREGRTAVPELSPATYRALIGRPWPGNSSELRTVLERAFGASQAAAIIEPHHLPDAGHETPPPHGIHDTQRRSVLLALEQNGFRRAETAAYLGISRKTLYNRLKRYGLDC